jgi:hypothetical protein
MPTYSSFIFSDKEKQQIRNLHESYDICHGKLILKEQTKQGVIDSEDKVIHHELEKKVAENTKALYELKKWRMETDKNLQKLVKENPTLKEQSLGGMASVGSGFVNPQGGTGRVGQFLQRQKELDECGESGGPMEDNVMQRYDQRYDPPMEENLAGFYEVPIEIEMTEKSEVVYDDENFVVLEKDKDTEEDSDEDDE